MPVSVSDDDHWLRVKILGPLIVERRTDEGWERVDLPNHDPRALLAKLACCPDDDHVSRDAALLAIKGDAGYAVQVTYDATADLREVIDGGRKYTEGAVGTNRLELLWLKRNKVHVDYDDFRDLRAQADHEEALALVRGDLAQNVPEARIDPEREGFLKEVNHSRAQLGLPQAKSIVDALIDQPRKPRPRAPRLGAELAALPQEAPVVDDDTQTLMEMGQLLRDAGIRRVHPDREAASHPENAQRRLSAGFRNPHDGEILMMGVSLRVFFNDQGEFFNDLHYALTESAGALAIRAVTSAPGSPQVKARARIEQPRRAPRARRKIDLDIEFTRAAVQGMVDEEDLRISLRHTDSAPYCTAVIFPDVAFFSPNILSPKIPVRLPMIEFEPTSHGYEMLRLSFEHIWHDGIAVIPANSPLRDAIEQRLRERIRQLRPETTKVTAEQLLHPLFREFKRPAEVHATLMDLRSDGLIDWTDDDEPGWIDGPDVEIRLLR
jgi:hypothetical protein